MGKLFIDTNVIIDIVEDRPSAPMAMAVLEYSRKDSYTRAYTSHLSIANTAYVVRKRTTSEIKSLISSLMKVINVLPCGDMQIMRALKCESPDFEDALQIACAESKECDVIITRNPDHFRPYTEIPVITPSEFVNHCGGQ